MTTELGSSNDNIPPIEWRLAEAQARKALKTQRSNAWFARQPPARRRAILAKDVLKWLARGKMGAAGYSLTGGGGSSLFLLITKSADHPWRRVPVDELHDAGKVGGYACQACALGGLFAVAVERDLCSLFTPDGDVVGNDTDAPASLRAALASAGCFAPRQMDLIEFAYEVGEGVAGHISRSDPVTGDPYPDLAAARAFGREHNDRRERMEAIMQNIIDNGGEFRP